MREKIDELCELIPAFNAEIESGRGSGTTKSKDYVRILFKNGSYIDNIAARESSRGKRRTDGSIEECINVDGDILNQVLIPTMNIDRMCGNGQRNEDEMLNKSQIFVTTAGYRSTFSYDKLIQILVRSVLEPDKAIVMGGTWRLPVLEGLQSRNFVNDLRQDGTFNDAAFRREYESEWVGSVEDAFFNADAFDRNRILVAAESELSGRAAKGTYYVLSMDVGRMGDNSVVTVFKVTPQNSMTSLKQIVNIFSFEKMHFEDQAVLIKTLYYKFKARRIVIDGNGVNF